MLWLIWEGKFVILYYLYVLWVLCLFVVILVIGLLFGVLLVVVVDYLVYDVVGYVQVVGWLQLGDIVILVNGVWCDIDLLLCGIGNIG